MAVVIEHRDAQKLLNDDQLWQVLKEHKQIVGLIAGHLHRAVYATWHGLPVWVGPSHSHAVTLDLKPNAPSTFSIEAPAIQLFRLEDTGETSHINSEESRTGLFLFLIAAIC